MGAHSIPSPAHSLRSLPLCGSSEREPNGPQKRAPASVSSAGRQGEGPGFPDLVQEVLLALQEIQVEPQNHQPGHKQQPQLSQ